MTILMNRLHQDFIASSTSARTKLKTASLLCWSWEDSQEFRLRRSQRPARVCSPNPLGETRRIAPRIYSSKSSSSRKAPLNSRTYQTNLNNLRTSRRKKFHQPSRRAPPTATSMRRSATRSTARCFATTSPCSTLSLTRWCNRRLMIFKSQKPSNAQNPHLRADQIGRSKCTRPVQFTCR